MAGDETREIARLSDELERQVRRIDESKFNAILRRDDAKTKPTLDENALRNLVRRRLPQPSKKRQKIARRDIPPSLQRVMTDLRLLDEIDAQKRFRLFVGYCRYRGYSYNTTARYCAILRSNGIFRDAENMQIDKFAFVDSGEPHVRAVDDRSFARLVAHLNDNFSRYTAPLLVAVYTGLRAFEILQWSAMTLVQLSRREPVVSITRKRTIITASRDASDVDHEYWRPVYTTYLQNFIGQLEQLYAIEIRALREHGTNGRLFHATHRTLANRVRSAFFESNGYAAPRGFGVHSCRNMIATLMARNTDNVAAIQNFLQHRNVSTTRRYVHADYRHLRSEFERITSVELSDVRRDLDENGRSSKEK